MVYDICSSLDCIESKMETIGKDIKHLLVKRAHLDHEQFNWEIVLIDNLEKLGADEKFIDRLNKLFLMLKKNKSPLIPKQNRTRIKVSQVIDRYIYSDESQQIKEDAIVQCITQLFNGNA
eukprot:4810_1